MKVALIIHGFPPEHQGGTEQAVRSLALDLNGLGHDVLVIAGSDRWESGHRVSREPDECGGFDVVRIHRADPHYGHWHKRSSALVNRDLRAVLVDERPEVIHVNHWLRLTDDVVRIAGDLGIPAVTTLHDYSSNCPIVHRLPQDTKRFCELAPDPSVCAPCAARHSLPTPWIDENAQAAHFERWISSNREELGASSVLVALSHDHAEASARLLALGEAPLVVEPALQAAPRRRTDRSEHMRLTLGAWGSIHELKGTDLLVEAVRRTTADVELRIAGQKVDPDFFARIELEAQGLPIQLEGPFDRLETHPVSDVDAFVSGSRAHETWGLVADEALALGLPVILPAAGAFPERFGKRDDALLYEQGDAGSLAHVIDRLASDPSLRARFFAPVTSAPAVASLDVAARYAELYQLALQRGPRRTTRRTTEGKDWMSEWDKGFEQHYLGGDA